MVRIIWIYYVSLFNQLHARIFDASKAYYETASGSRGQEFSREELRLCDFRCLPDVLNELLNGVRAFSDARDPHTRAPFRTPRCARSNAAWEAVISESDTHTNAHLCIMPVLLAISRKSYSILFTTSIVKSLVNSLCYILLEVKLNLNSRTVNKYPHLQDNHDQGTTSIKTLVVSVGNLHLSSHSGGL
jgi:hypothetical protein